MKLLFKFDEAGDEELKELLGFTDSNFKAENLKSDIISATDELKQLIGNDIYQSVVGIYEADSASDSDKELLYRCRLPIAIHAYRTYAPDNDIAHTTSGRVVRVEEHQKMPWEWQIDRSNKSLERKHYKALDALLNHLDSSVSGWKATQAYKDTHALFVRTTRDFDSYFDIGGSRLLLIKLSPGIRLAETNDIKPRIGAALFSEMKTKLKTDAPVDDDLLAKIKEACVYKALAWGMRRLSVQLFPEGVLQFVSDRMSTQGKLPAAQGEALTAAMYLDRDAALALNEIEEMIKAANRVPNEDIAPITPYSDNNDKFLTI